MRESKGSFVLGIIAMVTLILGVICFVTVALLGMAAEADNSWWIFNAFGIIVLFGMGFIFAGCSVAISAIGFVLSFIKTAYKKHFCRIACITSFVIATTLMIWRYYIF